MTRKCEGVRWGEGGIKRRGRGSRDIREMRGHLGDSERKVEGQSSKDGRERNFRVIF